MELSDLISDFTGGVLFPWLPVGNDGNTDGLAIIGVSWIPFSGPNELKWFHGSVYELQTCQEYGPMCQTAVVRYMSYRLVKNTDPGVKQQWFGREQMCVWGSAFFCSRMGVLDVSTMWVWRQRSLTTPSLKKGFFYALIHFQQSKRSLKLNDILHQNCFVVSYLTGHTHSAYNPPSGWSCVWKRATAILKNSKKSLFLMVFCWVASVNMQSIFNYT